MIACWEAKFHYYLWRPNHAIQRADTDDNPATSPDPTWLPLVTGNHPEYPSGHACMTASVTKSLQRYFGTKKVEWTLTSVVTGGTRTYERLGDLVDDVENARVWGGLHYRTTMTETAKHFPGSPVTSARSTSLPTTTGTTRTKTTTDEGRAGRRFRRPARSSRPTPRLRSEAGYVVSARP